MLEDYSRTSICGTALLLVFVYHQYSRAGMEWGRALRLRRAKGQEESGIRQSLASLDIKRVQSNIDVPGSLTRETVYKRGVPKHSDSCHRQNV
jgi:hypothetical protein